MSDRILILTTHPDRAAAGDLARVLLEQRLAACINILPKMDSIYRWEGQIETGKEYQLVIKTRAARYAAVEQLIQQRHPYELPEIICLSVAEGLPAYLGWIDEMTHD